MTKPIQVNFNRDYIPMIDKLIRNSDPALAYERLRRVESVLFWSLLGLIVGFLAGVIVGEM